MNENEIRNMEAGRDMDALVAEKVCPGCKLVKPHTEYWNDNNRHDGLRKYCKDCVRIRKRGWYQNNKGKIAVSRNASRPWATEKFKEYRREWQLRNRYGITQEQFDAIVAEQCGGCAICGNKAASNQKGDTLHVDHCHSTGEVRGLLCNRCNVGLANFRDDPVILEKAAQYLRADRAALLAVMERNE